MHRFALPLLHGFIGLRQCTLANRTFQLVIISRRSAQRAGTRFNRRGVNLAGQPANFVETEQIIESLDTEQPSFLCSLTQLRGSIPLLWSQKPNLKWLPVPRLLGDRKQQRDAFQRHITDQLLAYQNAQLVKRRRASFHFLQ